MYIHVAVRLTVFDGESIEDRFLHSLDIVEGASSRERAEPLLRASMRESGYQTPSHHPSPSPSSS